MQTHTTALYGAHPTLLDRAEVARRLSVHRDTVVRMTDRGDLPVVRVGPRLVRYRAEDIEAYIARNRDQASPENAERPAVTPSAPAQAAEPARLAEE